MHTSDDFAQYGILSCDLRQIHFMIRMTYAPTLTSLDEIAGISNFHNSR